MFRIISISRLIVGLAAIMVVPGVFVYGASDQNLVPYPCHGNMIEVMFAPEAAMRLRDGAPVDPAAKAMTGVEAVLQKAAPYQWRRLCDISEERLDELQARGQAKTGTSVYNLNNIFRLRIADGADIWAICRELEALPGIMNARPMPLPTPPPSLPPNYESMQGYLESASATPVGIDARYAWTMPQGDGSGVTVCDIEYSWNYNHADITKAVGSQINPNPVLDPFPVLRAFHGTAVIGELVADDNGWGTTGICKGANLKTCGSYFIRVLDPPDTVWDVPAAITIAINNLSAGDVILLEQQWDYADPGTAYTDYIPIEWWTDVWPNGQSVNGVLAAIQNAVANGIHVVEAGGNGGAPTLNSGYNTGALPWNGHSGAIIVGAGGVYTGGTWAEGDLQRISWSSYGPRYDLQGWGENVVTTGYGTLDSSMGYNYMYASAFDGTSSASPIVAGAAACCVGYWIAQGQNPATLTPAMLRGTLNSTGTAQVTPPMGLIGPRPNLRAAFDALTVAWTDMTAAPIDMYNQRSIGVAWGDYDSDGMQDLYVTCLNGNPNKLFRNTGGAFADMTIPALADTNGGYGAAWGDYDNDGDPDLYLANYGSANKLFRNDGGGAFADVTTSPLNDAGFGSHVSWVDYDKDGDLDIYLTNYGSANRLFRNDGGGSFTDVAAGAPLGYNGSSGGAAWGDYDNDGDVDVYLCCYYGETNHLFRNDGSGVFTDVTVAPLNDANESMGADWGDYDNDGDLDLYLVNNGQANKLFRNTGGVFTDVTTFPLNDTYYGISAGWADYDNDGDLDLYLTNGGTANMLFMNLGGGVFDDYNNSFILDNGYGMGFGWGDIENDGDLDIYLANGGMFQTNKLFRNEVGDDNHWIKLDLVGTISNVSAIGARVRLVDAGSAQIREVTSGSGFCSQHALTVGFGVGGATLIDSIIVRWPSGIVQTLTNVNVDNHIQLVEQGTIVCGDANSDGQANVGDAVYLINFVFKGGPAPNPLCKGDANDDDGTNVGDAVYLINFVFKGGPAPVPGCCP
jgi:hypothetical protein